MAGNSEINYEEMEHQEHPLDETIAERPVAIETLLQLIFKSRYGRLYLLQLLHGIQHAIRQLAPDLKSSPETNQNTQGLQFKRKANEKSTDDESENSDSHNLNLSKKGKASDEIISAQK